ncbi:3D domain-containing protein [uncultured Ruminococcus sp.]|uniref:3D domain-containing protein n=1 Tax=uncultured Ruminococcus sp. TaxID=165186 RepID=UPI0025F6DBB5|nr:3D domain-containing protein [uncultured Ruminococcus sp.]
MRFTADKLRIAKSAVALSLAATVVLSSVITVAAAIQSGINGAANSEDNNGFRSKVEYELSNGDLVVTHNNDFKLDVTILDANKITINNGGKSQLVHLAKGTVADALEKAGIALADDEISVPAPDSEITKDMEISIFKTKTVSVTSDGKTKDVKLALVNVYDALNFAGYEVDDDDILSTSHNEDVENINAVTIKRVTYKTESSKEKIAYDTVKKNSDDVELGETKVKREGKDGEKIVTREVKYIDGEKTSDKVVAEKTIKKPVDKVVLVGTKGAATSGGAGTFTDSNGATVAYSQVLTGSGTAYTAPAGAGTATGVPAYHGGVAVNPNIIPYGSKLYIVSTDGSFVYGYATAVDTGGALMAGTAIVDCYYNTYDECVNFGRRDVNVYVLA